MIKNCSIFLFILIASQYISIAYAQESNNVLTPSDTVNEDAVGTDTTDAETLGTSEILDSATDTVNEETADTDTIDTAELVESAPVIDQEEIERLRDEQNNIRESIRVSTTFDLYYWLESLGLSSDGTKQQKQKRLLEYYGIDSTALDPQPRTSTQETQSYSVESDPDSLVKVERKNTVVDAKVSEIVIVNAEKSEYFTLEQVDEDIFTLLGNVIIIVTEEDEKKQYKIQAEKITYNETLRRGTAEGSVIFEEFEYTSADPPSTPTGDPVQTFSSQVLVFDIDEFSTDIILGTTSSEKEVKYGKDRDKKEKLQFIIYSPHISNSVEEVIVAEKISFTTNKGSRPLYRIALRKMWILAPSEWVMSNGVIYMGNIPVMWIPFFFNPSDRFFFHPAIGFSSRNGAFINTTTYLLGDPAKDITNEAFLDIFDFGNQKAEKKVIKGLFLKEAEAGDVVYTFPKDWVLRLIGDYYTNLGAYAALKGKFTKASIFKSLEFETGFAVTQSIFKGTGDQSYFTYYLDENNTLTNNLDYGYFFNTRIPFRYHVTLDTSFDFSRYITNTIKFKHYSDAYIIRDFSIRQYDFTWQQVFDPNFDKKNLNKRSSMLSSFYWNSSSNLSVPLSKDIIGNYVTKLSVNDLRFQVSWNRKITKESSQPYAYKRGPGTIDQKIEGYFFYPSRIDVPSYKMNMSGTLLEYTFNRETANAKASNEETNPDEYSIEEEGEEEYSNDTSTQTEDTPQNNSIDDTQFPYPLLTIKQRKVSDYDFSEVIGSLKYTFTHSLIEQLYVNTKERDTPEEYDFFADSFINYGLLTTDNSFKVDHSLKFLSSIFVFSNSITLDLKYKTLNRDENLTETERDKLKLSNDNYTTEDLLSTNDFSIFYLKTVPYFNTSKVKYATSFFMSRHVFSTYKEIEHNSFEDKEWWKAHNITNDIVFNYSFTSQKFSIKSDIPPLDEKNTLEYSFSTFFSSLSSSIAFLRTGEDSYKTEPWNSSLSIFFFEKNLSFTQKQTYNVDKAYWETVNSNLKVWWFTSVLEYKHEYNYEYSPVTATFVQKDDKRLRPDTFSANVNYTFKDYWFWLDRIRTNFNIKLGYKHDFKKFINNKFTFSYGVNFFIHEILSFNIAVAIKNNRTFTYFPVYAEQVGLEEPRNIITDIIDGISIWDSTKLSGNAFELDSIKLGVTQDFGGWVFNFSYNGKPKLKGSGVGQEYIWDSVFEISVLWKPLPEFSSYAYYKDEAWSLEEEIE